MQFAYIEAKCNSRKFCLMRLLLTLRLLRLLRQSFTSVSLKLWLILFWCCCWPGFHVCFECFLKSTILTRLMRGNIGIVKKKGFSFLPTDIWLNPTKNSLHLDILPSTLILLMSQSGALRKGCCLFVIAEKTSLDHCLLLAVLIISDSNLSPNRNCVSLTNISLFSLSCCLVFLGSPVI